MDQPDDGFSAHALNRCFDRYGFVPTVQEALDCLQALQSGRSRQFGHGKGDAAHVRVRLAGVLVNLVYSASQKRVLTLLPADDLRFVSRGTTVVLPPSKRERRAFYRRNRHLIPR